MTPTPPPSELLSRPKAGDTSEEHDIADDKFMACRKPVDEALSILQTALGEK